MSCCPYCNYSLVDSSEDIISKHKEQCRRIYKNHTYLCNFCNTIIFKSNWTLFQRKYEFFFREEGKHICIGCSQHKDRLKKAVEDSCPGGMTYDINLKIELGYQNGSRFNPNNFRLLNAQGVFDMNDGFKELHIKEYSDIRKKYYGEDKDTIQKNLKRKHLIS